MPAGDNYDLKVEEKDLDKVMHSSFYISDNLIVMAVDDVMGITKPGTSVGLSLNFTNEDELETSKKIYEKLSEGGKIMMPYEKTFWGAYYCQIIDKFGIKWEVNHQLQ